jgi:hypothetical protein
MSAPTLPCLYLPDESSPDQEAIEKILKFTSFKGFEEVVCELLECSYRAVEVIFSEDDLEKVRGLT